MLQCLGESQIQTHSETLNALKLSVDLPLTHTASVHCTVEGLIQLKCAECKSGPLVFYDPLLQSFSSGHCSNFERVWTLWNPRCKLTCLRNNYPKCKYALANYWDVVIFNLFIFWHASRLTHKPVNRKWDGGGGVFFLWVKKSQRAAPTSRKGSWVWARWSSDSPTLCKLSQTI